MLRSVWSQRIARYAPFAKILYVSYLHCALDILSMDKTNSLKLSNGVAILLVGVVYYAFGRLGLLLAIPPGYATAVWPASGMALAGMLLLGYRVWLGVLLGSFFVNIGTSFDASSTQTIVASLTLALCIGEGGNPAGAGWHVSDSPVRRVSQYARLRARYFQISRVGRAGCMFNQCQRGSGSALELGGDLSRQLRV